MIGGAIIGSESRVNVAARLQRLREMEITQ